MRKIRCQKRIPGGRLQLPSCVIPAIKEAVTKDSIRFGASRSWVIAVMLAHGYGIKINSFIESERKLRRVK